MSGNDQDPEDVPQGQSSPSPNTAELWSRYKAALRDERDDESRELEEKLLRCYQPLVEHALEGLRVQAPKASREDLEAEGLLGLLEAMRAFDPERGVSFENYARYRIQGPMTDSLRRGSPPQLKRTRITDPSAETPGGQQVLSTDKANMVIRSRSIDRSGINEISISDRTSDEASRGDFWIHSSPDGRDGQSLKARHAWIESLIDPVAHIAVTATSMGRLKLEAPSFPWANPLQQGWLQELDTGIHAAMSAFPVNLREAHRRVTKLSQAGDVIISVVIENVPELCASNVATLLLQTVGGKQTPSLVPRLIAQRTGDEITLLSTRALYTSNWASIDLIERDELTDVTSLAKRGTDRGETSKPKRHVDPTPEQQGATRDELERSSLAVGDGASTALPTEGAFATLDLRSTEFRVIRERQRDLLQRELAQLEGIEFDDKAEMKSFADRLSRLVRDLGYRLECPTCRTPATALRASGAKSAQFQFKHSSAEYTGHHGGGKSVPLLKLSEPVDRRRKD